MKPTHKELTKTFFTADTHFGHKNILGYTNRPFKDIDEMNEILIQRWNYRISPQDTVYHLGDFCFGNPGEYIHRLNGNIKLIPGSHDTNCIKYFEYQTNMLNGPYRKEQVILHHSSGSFAICEPLCTIQINNQKIVLCHYAMRVWDKSHYNSWHLFAHSHGKLESQGKSMDIGVDTTEFFTPYEFLEIQFMMNHRPNNFNFIDKKDCAEK